MPLAGLGLAGALAANTVLAAPAFSSSNNVLVEGTSAPSDLTDPFVLSLGMYVMTGNLKSTFDGNAVGSNEPVDFAHTFDMNNGVSIFRLDGLWRITPKHGLRLVYFHNDLNRTRSQDKDFAWGDHTFLANAAVTANSKLNVYELSYEYTFIDKPTFQFAAGAGVHVLDMSIKLSGQATLTSSDGSVSQASYTTSNSNVPAPLPVIDARAAWAVTPSIFIEPEVQWLAFHYDDYQGSWWDCERRPSGCSAGILG